MPPTPEKPRVLMCAQLTIPPKPGYMVGLKCKNCSKPLQMSPDSQPLFKKHHDAILLLCNVCGIAFQKLVMERMKVEKSMESTLILQPAAQAALETLTGEPIIAQFPQAVVRTPEEIEHEFESYL